MVEEVYTVIVTFSLRNISKIMWEITGKLNGIPGRMSALGSVNNDYVIKFS